MIAFVVSNIEHHFYVNIAKGIEKTIEKQGYKLVLMNSMENNQIEKKSIESLFMRGMDGIVVAPTISDFSYLTNILPDSYPLVFVDRRPVNYAADVVLLDNAAAAYDAARHLLQSGCAKIGFVSLQFGGAAFGGSHTDMTIGERVEGYKQAVREAGLEMDEELVRLVPGDYSDRRELLHAESYRQTKLLLERNVDGIVCGNSLAALGVFNCLEESALRIPQDVRLVTFDDELWLSMTSPQITAIAQPSEAMGALAAKQVLSMIRQPGGAADKPLKQTLRLKADIIFRGSSVLPL
jgi:LacI family transcriptional regulator